MTNLAKTISIIIVNWNGRHFIQKCLNAVRQQTRKDYLSILVDNGSDDGSLELVQENYPEVKIIALSNNLGFTTANNVAIKSVNTEYVALLNPDAVPHPEWLEQLIKALQQNPEAGFAASKMLFYHKPKVIDRAGDLYTDAAVALLRGRGKPSQTFNNQEWIFGACAGAALYRKRMLQDIGLFDEDFFLLYEDVDLSFRAQLRGYKCLYVPEAIVYHMTSSSVGNDSPVSVYYSHRNLEWVYLQNMPASLIKRTLVYHVIYDIAAFFFFAAKGRVAEFVKSKWHAMKGLNRALKKRRRVQKTKKVRDEYIWALFEKELFLPRLSRRIRKS